MWDQQNRLKQVTKNGVTTTFTYRSDGLRASKTVNGVTTNYVYDGQTVVGETRSDGTSSWYTLGPNGYVSRTDVDSQGNVTNKEWYVYDGLGSCRAMVKPNAQGTDAVIVARYDYDVYGAVRTQSGSSSNKFKYVAGVGHPTDEETGLIYMRARYYDPGVGRFVSQDPAKQGVDWYTYVRNNPTNLVDRTGMLFGDLEELIEVEGTQNAEEVKLAKQFLGGTGIGRLLARWAITEMAVYQVVNAFFVYDGDLLMYLNELSKALEELHYMGPEFEGELPQTILEGVLAPIIFAWLRRQGFG